MDIIMSCYTEVCDSSGLEVHELLGLGGGDGRVVIITDTLQSKEDMSMRGTGFKSY
jgi:hypothetical protein